MKHFLALAFFALLLTGCQSTLPIHSSSKTERIHEQYEKMLIAFREVTYFKESDMQKQYLAAENSYIRGLNRAEVANHLIKRIDESAQEILAEWENEIKHYSDKAHQQKSQIRFDAARERHEQQMYELKELQSAMQPVIRHTNDLVLHLRHNLKEAALRDVPPTSDDSKSETNTYIESINSAIEQADDFLSNLDQ